MKLSKTSPLPLLIAGPILRKTTKNEVALWLVTSQPIKGEVLFFHPSEREAFFRYDAAQAESIRVGIHAWVTLASIQGEFPTDTPIEYKIQTNQGDITDLAPHLLYQGQSRLNFVIPTKADYVLHGSCRNPHHSSKDSLVAADSKVQSQSPMERPNILMMSGDQIYADHVAGPTLDAIGQVISLLGLPNETLPTDSQQSHISSAADLYASDFNFFQRDKVLPHHTGSDSFLDKLFPQRLVPIFSSRENENHLITLSEFIAMYLLVWSPTLWALVNKEQLRDQGFIHGQYTLAPVEQQQWREENAAIDDFIQGLPQVQRLLAHIPTYMIFDDHDVTDDWNLTVGWEHAADQNAFASQVIGNGLAAYWLCQGWGNTPEKFDSAFIERVTNTFEINANTAELNHSHQQVLLQSLNRFEDWHYTIETSPKVIVLDTRTRRWRSESRMNKPSGLMDWEALIELQHQLMGLDKVIIVSAAPMFGVKFIETLQKMMTSLGQPLVIDAENWMAHPGSANTLISIFTHTKTPTNFVVLSGDVHYSFAYDIKLRYRKNSPNIYQITCSGIKNEFPAPLLKFCDIFDRLLYSPHSVLNYFTKRKRLKIEKRSPDNQSFYRLSNRSAIGELRLDDEGKPTEISTLSGTGENTHFPAP